MNIPDDLLGEGWYWAAWLAWCLLFARSVRKADWARLRDGTLLNVWLGMIVLLMLVWSLKAGVKPGLTLHMVGAMLATLCLGPHLAFIALSLVLLGLVVNGVSDAFAFALNALVVAASGVWISQAVTGAIARHLPHHFFVFIFVNGFFGAALAVGGIGLVSTLLLATTDTYALDYLLSDYLPYFILLGFSEAWLSGMVLTVFVVYRPQWVAQFDDAHYLVGK